jgi:formylglycine-generating enzyme required for sulfatase activity/serine/threonine protein kinase
MPQLESACPRCQSPITVGPPDLPFPCPSCGVALASQADGSLTVVEPNQATRSNLFAETLNSPNPGTAARADATIADPLSLSPAAPFSFLSPPQQPDELGRLGGYRVLRELGRGGMGLVLQAEDERLKRRIALKVMLPHVAVDEQARLRFVREAQVAAALEHDHVVTIHQVGEENGIPFIAMPFLKGESLDSRLKGVGKLPADQAARIGLQIAEGLAAAHDLGLIHRDIKPANIWLEEPRDRVKILDFGLARLATSNDTQLTSSGAILGTPAYMAPEQARSQKPDARSDLFSLGAVLYRALTGQQPFRGDDLVSLLTSLAADTPASPRSLDASVPPELDALVTQLLAKKPEQRPASASEVAERLQPLVGSQPSWRSTSPSVPISTRSASEEARSASEGKASTSTAVRRNPQWRSAPRSFRRSQVLLLAGVAALVILIPVAGFLLRRIGESARIDVPPQGSATIVGDTGWHGWPADAPKPAIAPFDAEQARAHQKAWAEYLGVPVEYENSIGMKFSLIPPGEFEMGSSEQEINLLLKRIGKDWGKTAADFANEQPKHHVVLTQPFYLGIHEVTQANYVNVRGTNPARHSPQSNSEFAAKVKGLDTSRFPVESLTWRDAQRFCDLLNDREQILPSIRGYSFASEAEWEYACRAGTVTQFYTGDDDNSLGPAIWQGYTSDNRPHVVGESTPNSFSLFDMHGNVAEYVDDLWQPAGYKQFADHDAVDPHPTSADGASWCVGRGGYFNAQPFDIRSACRTAASRDNITESVGFRVALSVDAVKELWPRKKYVVSGKSWHGWPADAPKPAIAPFDAEQAEKHQKEWAEYLGVPVEWKNSIGMKFRLIPPGEFMMGSPKEEIEELLKTTSDLAWHERITSEGPQHKVISTKPFYVGVHEVTQGQYEQLIKKNPAHFDRTVAGSISSTNHPVEMVSWNDAAEFCATLSISERLEPNYARDDGTVKGLDENGSGYRLPCEAEWEFACRAGKAGRFCSGDTNDDLARVGWFGGNSGNSTHAVGELSGNPFGLYDVHGNVWEWVHDRWDLGFYEQFRAKPAVDSTGPSAGVPRVVRGGEWRNGAINCRSASRGANVPTFRYDDIGFRVALSVDAVKELLARKDAAASGQPWQDWPADAPKPAIAPFDAEQAKQHQKDWAEYLKVPVEYENFIGMKFRLIPPGEFMMGSTQKEIDDWIPLVGSYDHLFRSRGPQHSVILTQPLYIGIQEVTQGDYAAATGKNPSAYSPDGSRKNQVGKDTTSHPVETVSWQQAREFCAKLSEKEDLASADAAPGPAASASSRPGYRLLTEAEWEFSCRAGATTPYWCGAEEKQLNDVAWWRGNSGNCSHAAGGLKSNPFGLYDVHGNVWEWVEDAWDSDYYKQFSDKPAVNPQGTNAVTARRAYRGGSFAQNPGSLESAHRDAQGPTFTNPDLGFRIALPVRAVKELLNREKSRSSSKP